MTPDHYFPPMQFQENANTLATDVAAVLDRPDFRSPARTSVLFVDDDPAVRTPILRGLEQAGFRVEEAADGNRALAKLRTATFDWVVTDIGMPGRDGFELIQSLRRDYPQTRIIAITGGGVGTAAN